MMKDKLIHFTDSNLIVFGFILFMSVFLGTLIWTLFIQEEKFYDKLSTLPLKGGDKNGQ